MNFNSLIRQIPAHWKHFIPFFYVTSFLFTRLVDEYYIKTSKYGIIGVLASITCTVVVKIIISELLTFVIWRINEDPRIRFYRTLNLCLIQLYSAFITEIVTFPQLQWSQRFLRPIFLTPIILVVIAVLNYFKFLSFERNNLRGIETRPNRSLINAVKTRDILVHQPLTTRNPLTVNTAITQNLDENAAAPTCLNTDLYPLRNDVNTTVPVEPQRLQEQGANQAPGANPPLEANTRPGAFGDNQQLVAGSKNLPTKNVKAAAAGDTDNSEWQLMQSTTRSGKVYFETYFNATRGITKPVQRNVPTGRRKG